MGHLEDLSTDELELKIKEREKELKEIYDFVKDIIIKKGRLTKQKQGSSNTYVEWELKDFGGFNFFFSSGHTMFGGESVKIWDNIKDPEPHLCLWIDGGDVPNVKVCDGNFWPALKRVIAHKEEIIETMEKKAKRREKQERKKEQKRKDDLRRAELIKEAEKLKI